MPDELGVEPLLFRFHPKSDSAMLWFNANHTRIKISGYVLIFALAVILGACGSTRTVSERDLEQTRGTRSVIDELHPRNFVRIYECPSEPVGCNEARMLLSPHDNGGFERVSAEVDSESKIIIEFDRERLQRHERNKPFEAAISITGQIDGRAVEIPGYYEVGEQARAAEALVRSSENMRVTFEELARRSKTIHDLVQSLNDISGESVRLALEIHNQEVPAAEGSTEEARQRLEQITHQAAEAEQLVEWMRRDSLNIVSELQRLKERLTAIERTESTQLEPSPEEASQIVPSSSIAFPDDIHRRVNELEAKREQLNFELKRHVAQLKEFRDELENAERALDNAVYAAAVKRSASRYQRVRHVRARMLGMRPQISVLLDELKAEANEPVLRLLTLNLSPPRNPNSVRSIIATVPAYYNVVANTNWNASPDSVQRTIDAILQLGDALVEIASGELPPESDLRLRLITELRDTAILLPSIDADPGDELYVTIKNSARAELARTLSVRLKVRDFGFNRKVSDSFMFIRPINAEADDILAREGLDRSGITPDGLRLIEDELRDYKFTGGGSLLWTWTPRRSDRFAKRLMRWIEPSVGINVSFPRLTSPVSTATTTRSDAGEQGADDTQPTPDATQTTVMTSNTIDVVAGPLFALFDGSVTFSFQRRLTSRLEEHNWYWGVGFSFVDLVRRLSE